jgi:hypothetical protein
MLQEADFDIRDFEDRNAGDKGVYAKFFVRPIKNDSLSAEAGRPIYEDREYVEIQASGNSTNIIVRPVTDMDRQRFNRAYALFKSGDLEQITGTRLTEVPWMSRSQCEELAYFKILTVEQLSQVNDQFCTNVPGLYELKRRATAFLEKSEVAAPITALQKENGDLKAQIAALTEAVEKQALELSKLKKNRDG